MKSRVVFWASLAAFTLACADATSPSDEPPVQPTSPRDPTRQLQQPIQVIGTNPALASLSTVCPQRCAFRLPFKNEVGLGLNEMADVLGETSAMGQYADAIAWRHGQVTQRLISFRADGASVPYNMATDANSYRQIVGRTNDDDIQPCMSAGCIADEGRAALWEPEGYVLDIGTLGGKNSLATAVNDWPAVVGYASTGVSTGRASEQIKAFYWTWRDGMKDLGTLGGISSRANDINNNGMVVGVSQKGPEPLSPFAPHYAFVWTQSDGMRAVPTPPSATGSGALAVNDGGWIAGYIGDSFTERRAVVWTNTGEMIELGTLGGAYSWATDINHWNEVVGISANAEGKMKPFVWRKDTGIVALESSGLVFSHPIPRGPVINSWGDVVAALYEEGSVRKVTMLWAWDGNQGRYGF